ncbi:unnamed protein product [Coregonus sp. 'balchen']|nr:unnamed protein product [Coregonus sp. 'balchen']
MPRIIPHVASDPRNLGLLPDIPPPAIQELVQAHVSRGLGAFAPRLENISDGNPVVLVAQPSLTRSLKPRSVLGRFHCGWYRNMGNLLKVLTCTDLEQEPNFFLDFENAQPTDAEREVWEKVDLVLKDARGILDELQAYKGAGEEIREAIQNPSDDALQEAAWTAVVPLEAALHSLLGALTSETYNDPTQNLEREQALAKQFAEILHFTLRFDELKAEGENEVNNELANRISLFYADATPVLKTLSDGTTKFVSENKNLPIENTTDCLSTMASMKGCIKVLRDQPPNSVEGLLNALRYTTKHLNDESTNKTIKSMLQ